MLNKKAGYIKMSKAAYPQFSNAMLNDVFKNVANDRPYYLNGKLYVPKGKMKIMVGWDGEDFINNLVTVIAERFVNVTRVPRIVKRLYNK